MAYRPSNRDGGRLRRMAASRIREDWASPIRRLDHGAAITSRYRGKRYSFGYPACPSLEDQAAIWKLLKPEEIGVQLTEGFMMDPEPA